MEPEGLQGPFPPNFCSVMIGSHAAMAGEVLGADPQEVPKHPPSMGLSVPSSAALPTKRPLDLTHSTATESASGPAAKPSVRTWDSLSSKCCPSQGGEPSFGAPQHRGSQNYVRTSRPQTVQKGEPVQKGKTHQAMLLEEEKTPCRTGGVQLPPGGRGGEEADGSTAAADTACGLCAD